MSDDNYIFAAKPYSVASLRLRIWDGQNQWKCQKNTRTNVHKRSYKMTKDISTTTASLIPCSNASNIIFVRDCEEHEYSKMILLPPTITFTFTDIDNCTLILFARSLLRIFVSNDIVFAAIQFVQFCLSFEFTAICVEFQFHAGRTEYMYIALSLFNLLELQWWLSKTAARCAVSTKFNVIPDNSVIW